MSQPKLPADLAAKLHRLNLEARCYQPVTMFKPHPPRKLPNVPREDDPWHVTLWRLDRPIWANGGLVSQARAATLRETVEIALATRMTPGVLECMKALSREIDTLTEVVNLCPR